MKIIDYNIVAARDKEELVKYVNIWISKGWQPMGGIEVFKSGSDGGNSEYFNQTMVKYEQT